MSILIQEMPSWEMLRNFVLSRKRWITYVQESVTASLQMQVNLQIWQDKKKTWSSIFRLTELVFYSKKQLPDNYMVLWFIYYS